MVVNLVWLPRFVKRIEEDEIESDYYVYFKVEEPQCFQYERVGSTGAV